MILCSFFHETDDEEHLYNDVPVEILFHEQENIAPHMQSLHRNASSVGIILGGKVVMDVENLPQAMHIVFGLTYALHLNYPKYRKKTFDFFFDFFFLQQVLLNSNFKHSRISRKVEGKYGLSM